MDIKKLFEAENDDIELDDIEVDETEVNDDPEEYDDNDLIRVEISFPLLIESFDNEDNPIEPNDLDVEDFVNQYADAVIDNFEENKKFILSALDMFDFEIYYREFDSNSNIHFIMELAKDVTNDLLINVVKRYFKVDLDNFSADNGYLTLQPALENKYLTIS